MTNSESAWIPVIVALIAGASTVGVQLWINRGEPAAIKRIKLLSDAIDSIPDGDAGRAKLVQARTHVATRVAISLIGLRGAALYFRRTAWWCFALGAALFSVWALYSIWMPASLGDAVSQGIVATSLLLLVAAPGFLINSFLAPAADVLLDIAFARMSRRRQKGTTADDASETPEREL